MYEELIRKLRTTAKAADFFGAIMPAAENPITALYNEAADAIEDLENKLNLWRQGKISRWVSVTERPPEKPEGYPKCEIRRTYYLVALKSGCVKTLGYEFDRNEWQITGSPVVAWMPLPEPPKEEI